MKKGIFAGLVAIAIANNAKANSNLSSLGKDLASAATDVAGDFFKNSAGE